MVKRITRMIDANVSSKIPRMNHIDANTMMTTTAVRTQRVAAPYAEATGIDPIFGSSSINRLHGA
jgi:hypothetical protein